MQHADNILHNVSVNLKLSTSDPLYRSNLIQQPNEPATCWCGCMPIHELTLVKYFSYGTVANQAGILEACNDATFEYTHHSMHWRFGAISQNRRT